MANEHKKLPGIILEGTLFTIDTAKEALVQVTNPDNMIPFFNMKDEDNYYTILYNLDTKNVQQAFVEAGKIDEETRRLFIPAEIINSGGYDKPYAQQFNEESYKYGKGVLLIDDKIETRLQGQLPTIDIAGSPFIIDYRLNELRPKDDFSARINLEQLELDADGRHYLGLYHVPSKQVVELEPTLTRFPKDVVMVEIPGELVLDPVGVARRYGLEDTELLRAFPIRDNLQATVKHLSETPVNELVRKNREQLVPPKQDKTKSLKRKRGRGL